MREKHTDSVQNRFTAYLMAAVGNTRKKYWERKCRLQGTEYLWEDNLDRNYTDFEEQYRAYIGEHTDFIFSDWKRYVWLKIVRFLGTLNGENVKRESYVRTPEFEAALGTWKETEQEWESFLETLPADGKERAEEMKECLEDFSSAQEKRAYVQGYADCIQVLFHMGLLKENEELKWEEKKDVY